MNGDTLLDSLQYVEDRLLEEAEAPLSRGQPWRRWGAVAACAALLLCGGLLLRSALEPGTESLGITVRPSGIWTSAPEGYVNLPNLETTAPGAARGSASLPMPGEVTGPGAATPGNMAPAEPEVFSWVEVYQLPYPDAEDVGGVVLVGRELTEEQVSACAPEVRLDWMRDFSGSAIYKLADGSGGLNGIELSVTHEETGYTCQITLREATPERLAAFGLDRDNLPLIDGECYAACREYYDRGDGERVSILVAFVREDVLYTLQTDVPAEEKNSAATDLLYLFIGYVRSHSTPDLDSFVYEK